MTVCAVEFFDDTFIRVDPCHPFCLCSIPVLIRVIRFVCVQSPWQPAQVLAGFLTRRKAKQQKTSELF